MPTAKKKRPNREAVASDLAAPPPGPLHQVVPAGGALVTRSLVLQNETGQSIGVEFLGTSEVKLNSKRARKR